MEAKARVGDSGHPAEDTTKHAVFMSRSNNRFYCILALYPSVKYTNNRNNCAKIGTPTKKGRVSFLHASSKRTKMHQPAASARWCRPFPPTTPPFLRAKIAASTHASATSSQYPRPTTCRATGKYTSPFDPMQSPTFVTGRRE